MSPTYITADQFLVSASIGTPGTAGYLDLGTWATKTGGDTTSPVTTIYPGGMQPGVPVTGRRTTDTISLRKPFEYGDAGRIIHLDPRVGRANVNLTYQPLDADGHPFGAGFSRTGLLIGLIEPEPDAGSEDATNWGIDINPRAVIGAINT